MRVLVWAGEFGAPDIQSGIPRDHGRGSALTTRRQVAGLAVFMLVMGAVMIAMTWSANTGSGRVLIVALFPVVTVGGLA